MILYLSDSTIILISIPIFRALNQYKKECGRMMEGGNASPYKVMRGEGGMLSHYTHRLPK